MMNPSIGYSSVVLAALGRPGAGVMFPRSPHFEQGMWMICRKAMRWSARRGAPPWMLTGSAAGPNVRPF